MANLRAKIDYENALANKKYLADKYGGTSEQWKSMGTASLLGADVMDGFDQWANASLSADAIESQQKELTTRANVSIANILSKGEKVQGVQTAAFMKSGVKLEGSALNVLYDTANQALDAAKIRQQEATAKNTNLEIQKRMAETQAEYAPLETILSMGSTLATQGD